MRRFRSSQNRVARIAVAAIIFAQPLPINAQDPATDPAALSDLVAQICLFNSLEFDAQFAAAKTALAASGMPLVMEQEQTVMYGDPAATNLVVGRKIDELFCALRMPASAAPKEVFLQFESKMAAAITATYPTHISQPGDDPSPHVEGHDWVASIPGKMHFATSLAWGTEDGLLVAVGFHQLYE